MAQKWKLRVSAPSIESLEEGLKRSFYGTDWRINPIDLTSIPRSNGKTLEPRYRVIIKKGRYRLEEDLTR